MTREEFREIEQYMLRQMQDSAHDRHHVYRVLYSALDIAGCEEAVDYDVLLAACLLHDIGRRRQFDDPRRCHAQTGGEMARDFLLARGWSRQRALHVQECIGSHRFRGNNPPQSIEAKILFDSDKLDVCGAIGIARTLIYGGQVAEPLYVLDENGDIVVEGGGADISSFFQEYHYKLRRLADCFYTGRAAEIAAERQKAAAHFYDSLYSEIDRSCKGGSDRLRALLAGG